ncbi:MAG: hypothetical protein HY907_16700 [Deltaproteobacteria bacterium]|nr:hypothetical protein [Deltaproteobacteria bacterium]
MSRKSFSPNFRLVSLLLLCFLICLLVRSPAFDILLVILLAALLFLVGLRPRGATGTSVAVAPGFGTAPAPGLMVRLRVAWSRLLARTALYRVFGWRHTRYFRQFVQALEKGDWREGLRRAVPLGALDAWKNALASPAWRLPRPRETLGIDLAGGRNSPRAIVVAGSFYADLHALYRATFERLVAEGRIEEAAFVLADLLRASTEAVGFLERHGRLTTAAQLAEARELPPGLVVRQWFLAGDVGRAVRIARDRGAFFDAVRRTERTEPEVSRALRLQWADALADGGDFAGAARTAWTVPEAVPLVRGWVERGLTVGEGDVAALLAMRALQNAQDGKLDLRAEQERLEVRLFLDTPPSHANGFGFVRALYAMGMSPGVRPLARWALRRALQLEPASQSGSVAQLARLARSADDAALAADLPRRSPPVESFPERRAPLDLALAGTGPTPIYDVVLFGSGRSVLALGEAGIALLDARGRLLRRVDEPAHRLVRSDHGDRVLLLARRGASHRVCRVELATGRIRDLGDVQVHTFASSYDGRHLFVGEGDRLLALVADEDRLRVAWSTGLEEKRVAVVGRAPDRLSVVVASDDFELWTFSLPGLVLRRREAVTVPGITSGDGRSRGVVMPVAIAADGVPLILVCKGSAGEAAVFRGGPGLASRWSPADPASNDLPTVFAAGVSGDVVWLAGHQPLSGVLELRLFQEGEMRARLRLPHSRTASVSVAHERVAVADDQGRFAVLDLDTGALWGHSGAVDGEGGTV